jgi:phosphoribosylglycinamide formyltransferase-1
LPKYGGKGMYGDRVHNAILAAKEEESGITIHFVNEEFDEGEMIHQSRFKIDADDDLEMVKFKGQQLEHLHFAKVIENLLKKMKS